jgi:predicted HicB family RNase H-like nuclease
MEDVAKSGRDADKFMFRMPAGLREKLKLAAERDRRSMNSQLVMLVENALKGDDYAHH